MILDVFQSLQLAVRIFAFTFKRSFLLVLFKYALKSKGKITEFNFNAALPFSNQAEAVHACLKSRNFQPPISLQQIPKLSNA